MNMIKQKFDVAIIGGGPAGLMAAGRAGQNGATVVLLEKNNELGRKLLITGKGRCNLTNAGKDNRAFIKELGQNGPFLFSVLNSFSPQDAINFFNQLGVKTKIERGNRVFPCSDKSSDILQALINFAEAGKVKIIKNAKVLELVAVKNKITLIKTTAGDIAADKIILATGGKSYPATGSTGDGYCWAAKLGHTVIEPKPALVPIIAKEKWLYRLEGLSLKNVAISVWQNNKKQAERFGEALFTDKGLSGPIIIDLSQTVGELLEKGKVELKINFKPTLDYRTLDQRLQTDFLAGKNKAYKNYLAELLPKKMMPIIIEQSKIPAAEKIGLITKAERAGLIELLTKFPLTVDRLDSFAKAIITAGGLEPKEIDPKTMQSKIISNLYFAGEIIDVHGPTGGYNLQIAFATGHLAGGGN